MELITYEFSLDTHKNGSQRTLQGFETGDTYSRRFVISLTEGDESYKLPLDNCVAVMYVKRPSQSSPSINSCAIEGNKIIYDVESTDLIEEGITQMQLKVVEGTIASPTRVLVSPRFDVEVWESLVSDSEAEDTQTYTALEEAIVKAQMAYDARITSFAFDENLVLTVTYGVANDYNEDKAYAVNDICYYEGKAWKCIQACTGETPEEGTYWTEVSLSYAKVTYTTDVFKDTFDEVVADITPSITIGTVTEGSPTSVTNSGTTLNPIFDFVIEKGDKGDDGADGADGADGYSPSATVVKVDDTATITITDKDGTTTATISDGADGQDGADGADGADGFSPSASVTKSGKTATISITDKDGTTTASISDGNDSVSWNQIQATGTKIATITIDSTPTDIYAPTSGGASSLSGLSDVTIASALDGQALTYDNANSVWKNTSLSIPADIDDLSDVTITSATSGQVLKYDGSKWANANESGGASALNDLSDVTISSASSGEFLKYDGSKWVNGSGGGGASALNDLSDVTITSASSGQVLSYDGSKWVNGSAPSGGHTIKNPSGTSMTARANLQFMGSGVSVTDDSGNDVTKVTVGGTVLSSTLATGSTTLTFTDASISSSAMIDVYVDNYNAVLTNMSVASTTLTLTFQAMNSAVEVKVRIS